MASDRGTTGPYTPSCAAPMHPHSPPPCARQHKHAAWNATPATREHHRTSHSSSSSITHTSDAQERDTHLEAFFTTRHKLQEWQAQRMAAAAQERER